MGADWPGSTRTPCWWPPTTRWSNGPTAAHRIAVGAQYTPDPTDRHYTKRMQYRVGASYSTPYLRVNGTDGPSEMTLAAGLGLPISNKANNRSMVNVGLQWLRRKPASAGLITENYFMVNVGLTFNEKWFMKFKIQ